MDAGGLAQMHGGFSANGLPMPNSGLASRRGGQNIKPLSFDTTKSSNENRDNGAPTPRTSRSHLLAGLRTAPKSATAATFPASPTTTSPVNQMKSRNSIAAGMYGNHESLYNGPKTSLPRYGQPQGFNGMTNYSQHYTAEQILAPPELSFEEQTHEQMDPNTYAQLLATNLYLAQQKQRLQQQLLSVQAAQQQFQTMNINTPQPVQPAYQALLQQQQLLQQQVMAAGVSPQPNNNVYAMVDPATGQTYYVNQPLTSLNTHFAEQYNMGFQQPSSAATPRVQVSPPPVEAHNNSFRNVSPPRRVEVPVVDSPTPLPPPSANAFRRSGHKKSLSSVSGNGSLSVSVEDVPKSAGPRTAHFPLTPAMTGSYGPGQARAGEHPIRQPRGPPSFDELVSKPTSKHDGSKNFVTRTRRSAVHNLTRAGISRRQVANPGSSGSISPISESAEELATPLTDDDSVSGSGSLNGDDVECSPPSSRTSTGSWGAIGSDRPTSRQRTRKSVDSLSGASDNEGQNGSFASVFKSAGKPQAVEAQGQRKAPMLVLTSAEKRKSGNGF